MPTRKPPGDAQHVGDDDQQRQCEQTGQQARRHQVFHGIGGQGAQRVDLVGDPHGAEFGRHRGTHTPGDHEASQDRPEFTYDGQDDHAGGRTRGVEAGEAGVALQRDDHAGEQGGQRHDRQAEEGELDEGLQEHAAVEGRAHQVRQAGRAEGRDGAGATDDADRAAAQCGRRVQRVHHAGR